MNKSNHPIRTVRSERFLPFLISQFTFASLFFPLSFSLFFSTPAPLLPTLPLLLSSSPPSPLLFFSVRHSSPFPFPFPFPLRTASTTRQHIMENRQPTNGFTFPKLVNSSIAFRLDKGATSPPFGLNIPASPTTPAHTRKKCKQRVFYIYRRAV